MEKTQNQAVVCVVPCIPDRHVLEHTTVFAQYVVSLGVHLSSTAKSYPHLPIPQPRLAPWE